MVPFVGCWGNGHVAGETQSSSRKKKVKTQGRAGVEKVDGLVYGSPTFPARVLMSSKVWLL
jgi:hypothetical protein